MKKILLSLALSFILITPGPAQSLPAGIDSGYIDVEGGRLFYEAAGKGANIVLLHDGMVNREIWNEQFPVLAKYYRVTRYDRRGYGKSTDPVAPYSHIEDLNRVFTQLKIDKATVFGMSSGGACAIDFTLKYPEKVTGLVLVGAVVGGFGYTTHMTYRGGHLKSIEELSDPVKSVKYFVWDDPFEIYEGNTEAKMKVAKILENNIHKTTQWYSLPPDRIGARYLSEIKVPGLVLVGEYDIPDVHAHAGVIDYGIPNARREVISESGHLVPIEQPELFNESVFRFLRYNEFYDILNTKGVNAAVQYFSNTYRSEPAVVFLRESEMNSLGYRYLQEGKTGEAIGIFRINTIAYPDSWNVFDSLGEAYLKDGQTDLAVKNYEISLKLNPANENARKVLEGLKEKK